MDVSIIILVVNHVHMYKEIKLIYNRAKLTASTVEQKIQSGIISISLRSDLIWAALCNTQYILYNKK